MEIQDLSYDNLYRKPPLIPEQVFDKNPQKSETFRPTEGIVDISLSVENDADSNADTPPGFANFAAPEAQFATDNAPSLAEIRQDFEANSAELNGRLRQFYSRHGIQAPVAANISVNSQGRVVVAEDFQHNAELEAEFATDPALVSLFNELSAAASLLRASDVADNFGTAYARNPTTARQDNAHLFSDRFKFEAQFNGEKLSAAFKPEGGPAIPWWQET